MNKAFWVYWFGLSMVSVFLALPFALVVLWLISPRIPVNESIIIYGVLCWTGVTVLVATKGAWQSIRALSNGRTRYYEGDLDFLMEEGWSMIKRENILGWLCFLVAVPAWCNVIKPLWFLICDWCETIAIGLVLLCLPDDIDTK